MSLVPLEPTFDNKFDKKLKPVTVQTFRQRKAQHQKIVTLTCYDYSTARLLDETALDLLLVGDSLAMTMLGHPNTLSVTVDEMLHHTKAVSRGAKRAFVVADMPFMSYQAGHDEAVKNAARFIQEGGARGVKLEGASERILSVIQHLTEIGIPVLGHLGFTPQSLHTMGGYKVQGKSLESAKQLFSDALKLQEAGCFGVVLEMVPLELAMLISQRLEIPTIGIGAGAGCDGQILVIDDLLGRYPDMVPRFARPYANLQGIIKDAIECYAEDIKTTQFPNHENESFHFPEDQLAELYQELLIH